MKLESGIQQAIINYLSLLELQGKVYWFRNNSFAGFIQRANGSVGRINNAKRGMPDIVVCYQGRFIAIEVKAPRGRQSEFQKEAEAAIKKAGGDYILARSLDDIVTILK